MSSGKASDKTAIREALLLNGRALGLWWRNHPGMIASSAACSILSALAPYVGIYLSARLMNELAGARSPERLAGLALASLLSAAALAFGSAALNRWKNCEFETRYHKRAKFYADKLLELDFSALDDPMTGELRSQIEQNERWGGWGLAKTLLYAGDCVKAIARIAGAAALTVSLFTRKAPESAGALTLLNHPLSMALILAVMLLITFFSPMLGSRAERYWVRYSEQAKLGNRIFSFYGFMANDRSRAMDIRIYGQEKICRCYADRNNSFLPGSRISRWARGPMGGLKALSAAVSGVFTGLVYVFVCLKAWAGAFGVGSVTQYIGAIRGMSEGAASLFATLGDMRNNAAFLRTTFDFLDIPNNMYQGSFTVEKRTDGKFEVEFRDVSFRYPFAEGYALRHVNLRFEIGKRLAVVGENGSGKTTFIKLLCRLYDPSEGVILLNGIDIRKYNYAEYLSVFAVVFQDFRLLAFPLGENVAAGREYDRERVVQCLEKAGFQGRLERMPHLLETCLYRDFEDDGVEVSGGEAQKIAIARALYKTHRLLSLTSSPQPWTRWRSRRSTKNLTG